MSHHYSPIALALLVAVLWSHPSPAQDVDDDWDSDPWGEEVSPWSWHGFIEGAVGVRTRSNSQIDDDMTLQELRLQLEVEYQGEQATWRFKADGLADGIREHLTGEIREAQVNFPVGERTDVRIGRQVLTWGTGDLLFLNDLFPKDWVSFLSGRDDEYLKAPSDALRASWFGTAFNLDAVWTPVFEPDRFIDGRRLSYFDPLQNELTAAPPRLIPTRPARKLENSELALRFYGLAGAQEWALYGYRGFFGQPTAFDLVRGQPSFARLNSFGASVRGPLAGGLYNAEMAWYDSADDRSGDDPLVPNSEMRLLISYEREAFTNFTIGGQYYVEWRQDYSDFKANYPFAAETLPDELRQVFTLRLSYRMLRDNVVLGLMNFYSPSDQDAFIRPTVMYRYSDTLQFNAGANLFFSKDEHTFYGQFADNSNVFFRARYSF